MTLSEQSHVPKDVSLSWTPGERLLISSDVSPANCLDVQPTLPPPYLTMFFTAHEIFFNEHISPQDASFTYLALITNCLNDLRQMEDPSPEFASHLDNLIEDTHHAKVIWHLIHAIYLIDTNADGHHISHYLSNWYTENFVDFDKHDQLVASALADASSADGNDDFWKALTQLIISADFVSALDLLTRHINNHNTSDEWASAIASIHLDKPKPDVDAKSPPVVLLEAVLSGAPQHSLASRADGSWAHWQASCKDWADDSSLENCEPALLLLKAISGDKASLRDICETWEQMFMACTAYVPERNLDGGNLGGGLAIVADACGLATMSFNSPLKIASGAILEAASGNVTEAVVRLEASAPTSWFAAHLSDVLVRASKMSDGVEAQWKVDDAPVGIREFYLKEFARGLERYPGCWRIAIDYICACPTHGPAMLIDMLVRMPLAGTADPTIEKILLVCEQKNLRKTESAICEKLGSTCLHNDNLGGAMAWFIRAKLPRRAQSIADAALNRAQQQGLKSPGARCLECVVTALSTFGDSQMRSTLAYVTFYHDMLEARARISDAANGGNMRNSAVEFIESVRSLVRGDGLPRKYWCVVVFEAAKVLEMYPELLQEFPRSALLELMSALELASGPHRPAELTENLRKRLVFEARAAANNEKDGVGGRTPVKLDDALEHCRSVFVSCIAARIG